MLIPVVGIVFNLSTPVFSKCTFKSIYIVIKNT
jgi:hypothetical protein